MELITDVEAEQRIISALLHSENACIETFTLISEDDFYGPINRDLFLLTKSLYGRGVRPTYVEVLKEGIELGFLADRSIREEVQHISIQYIDDVNNGYWIDRVKQASKGRKAQRLIIRYHEEIQQANVDVTDFIERIGSDFMALSIDSGTEQIETGEDIATYGEKLVTENVEKWRKAQEDAKSPGQTPLEGVPTGLPILNNLTLGYKPGDLIILGAQTGHGKTAFALNTAMAASVDGKKSLLYINTEMSRKQIAYRWGAILSQIPLQKIRAGSLTNGELHQVLSCYKMLVDSGFYTQYEPNLTPDKLQTLARRAKLQHKTELLIVDYIGRMDKQVKGMDEWQVLEQIVKTQKILAQNLNLACMVLIQLNPDGTLQGAKRMKNECDLMLKLIPVDKDQAEQIRTFHKKQYEEFNYRIFIDKSRDSIAGIDIPIIFDKQRQQIREANEIGT